MIRHGHSKRGAISKTYRAWRYMIQRCLRPGHPDYKYYGGRGITVCEGWLVFDNFLRDMGCAPADRSLGRRDNSAGYCKSNCEWQTPREQAQNTRRNRYITFEGQTLCISEWARLLKVKRPTLEHRIKTKGSDHAIRQSITGS